MIEQERTFLAKYIPEGLLLCPYDEIIDLYMPLESFHPVLRLRKKNARYEMTKKKPINDEDVSIQEEQTIILSKEEFKALNACDGKRIHKFRYYYKEDEIIYEFDIFQEKLYGLVLVDVEFTDNEKKTSFRYPNFCLADVTQESFVAAGLLCGKSYNDIVDELNKFGYKNFL